ncbi:TetR/AcrR family transcriptional regulator C-terminal domain-containing protein [Pseudonocardia nigra]|uniref:TetR/AcrR family transcriptional regulator C-terminal domain-containing protein n=1 Tax=Pseudonocardia nigra TaxID=1921578 RepID=UPI001C5FBE14|nr:TetR/AcrR family transcriptional regulator C-terminal domain-containing protein [Pseudonocardia nigra]
MPPASEDRSAPTGLVWFDPPPRTAERFSREMIVTAAVELADEDVRGEVTMRAVAARVGARTPMSLYRYVGNKDGLVDLMLDEVYGEIVVPEPGDWRACLRELGSSGWEAVQRHPWFARLSFSRPPLGPHALAMYDRSLAALDGLGLDAATRMGFVGTVLGHVLSSGLALLEERAMRERAGLRTDGELTEAVRPYLDRIAREGRHPHFSRWAADPARLEPAPQSFEQVLEWLLDGLERSVNRG